MVEKKYIKIGVASLAVVALVIGLSVGITQSRKNKNSSAASASETYSNYAIDVCDDNGYGSHGSAKSGKSGSGSGGSKGAKSSGGGSYSGSGKSGKGSSYSGSKKSSRRRLVVPGTEEYQPAAVHSNQRRKLRQQLVTGEF